MDRNTERQLLVSFAETRDETAFEELVRCHWGMVVATCRRLVPGSQTAEDVAQAVFLTLAHKARDVAKLQSLGAWLHRMAVRVSLDVRKAEARRRRREAEAANMRHLTGSENPAANADVVARLHVELDALPGQYRQAIVLHHLQEMACADAAASAGCSANAFAVRVARARDMLLRRLMRRGEQMSPAALLACLEQTSRSAAAEAVPEGVASVLAKAATKVVLGKATAAATVGVSPQVVALTEGALNMLYWAKLKLIAAAAFAMALVFVAVGALAWRATAAEPAAGKQAADKPAADKPATGETVATVLFVKQESQKQDPQLRGVGRRPFKRCAWLVDAANKDGRLIVDSEVLSPCFNPDGKELYGLRADGTIAVFVEDEKDTRKLWKQDRELCRLEGQPRWLSVSPKGDRIACTTKDGIWLVDRQGKEKKQVVKSGEIPGDGAKGGQSPIALVWPFSRPSFSPDGQRVVFCCRTDAKSWVHSLFLADLESGKIQKLTRKKDRSEFCPVFVGADRLLFAACEAAKPEGSIDRSAPAGLFTDNLARDNEETLLASAGGARGSAVTVGSDSFALSPDGLKLAFHTVDVYSDSICVMSLKDRTVSVLVQGTGEDPAWWPSSTLPPPAPLP